MACRVVLLALLPLTHRATAEPGQDSNGAAHAELANRSSVVDPSVHWGIWEGWGVSLCWWANVFGGRDDFADLFFTSKTVRLQGADLPGLGLNIVRYNAGGCSWRCHGSSCMVVSPRMPRYKQIEGFWEDPTSEDPSSSSWNWTADTRQRAMLEKARARGATHFELFSNSPMWWMLHNRNPSGRGDDDNLLVPNEKLHARYLAIVAERARTHWGIDFASVSPANEPSAHWWRANGTQEGCHYSRPAQARLVREMRRELDRRGLGAAVAAPEECEVHTAVRTWGTFGSQTRQLVGKVNVHGYEGLKADRAALQTAVAGHRLWNSEYGDGDGSGLEMARNLHADLRLLRPTAWCYWQAADESEGWGLLKFHDRTLELERPEVKLWVLAHYTRHFRPGMRLLDGGSNDTVAAYDARARRLVLVAVNAHNSSRTMSFDLTRFPAHRGPVKRWATDTAVGGRRYVRLGETQLDARGRFAEHFEGSSLRTFEVEGVELPSDVLV